MSVEAVVFPLGSESVTRAPAIAFPSLHAAGGKVDAKALADGKAAVFAKIGLAVIVLGLAVLTIATMGAFLLVIAGLAAAGWWHARIVLVRIRGSAVEIGPDQLPALHLAAETFASRLGLATRPRVFIAEAESINAFALKVASHFAVVLTDEVVDAALKLGDGNVLAFTLAHELAHHALGHTGTLHTILAALVPPLRRLDEISADNVAAALVGSPEAAVRALSTLAVGPQLLPYTNPAAIERQARSIVANRRWKKAERTMTHALIMRRIAHQLEARG